MLAHAGHAADDAGQPRLPGCRQRNSGVFFRADSTIERLRNEPGANNIRFRDRLWKDARAQFAVARGIAEFYGVRAPIAAWCFAQVLHWENVQRGTAGSAASSVGVRLFGRGG